MKLSPRQYGIALYEAAKDAEEKDIPSYADNFSRILRSAGDVKSLNDIIAGFWAYDRLVNKKAEARITTAQPLSESARRQIKDLLAKKTEKTVAWKETAAPEILGGIIIKIDDFLFDASLKTKIDNLRKNLLS